MLSGVGCATRQGHANETVSALAVFDFENSSIDPVAVYLVVQHSQWLLGHVEPRRRARLRLPDYFTGSNHAEVTVVVVPVGSRRNGVLARANPDAICSEEVPIDELSSMRWTFSGWQVTGFMPPKRS
jgi:hypothetical protein